MDGIDVALHHLLKYSHETADVGILEDNVRADTHGFCRHIEELLR